MEDVDLVYLVLNLVPLSIDSRQYHEAETYHKEVDGDHIVDPLHVRLVMPRPKAHGCQEQTEHPLAPMVVKEPETCLYPLDIEL